MDTVNLILKNEHDQFAKLSEGQKNVLCACNILMTILPFFIFLIGYLSAVLVLCSSIVGLAF